MINPWENISFGSQRRIESNGPFDYYWIADASGHYGLFVQTENGLPQMDQLRLRGITIINRTSSAGKGELILVLNSNADWELFMKICTDLVKTTENSANEDQMVKGVYSRLKKWQLFLKQKTSANLSLIEQMGLFTELDCLLNRVIPHQSAEQSINSWTGADFDKQDFSLDQKLVEVKSYISSKGAFVAISSLHQLDNGKKPLYLLVYGLSASTVGLSVIDLVEAIESVYANNTEALERFQEKLSMYGYISGVTEPPFYKFQVDRQLVFFVDDRFPKITSANVPHEVNSVSYTLDILKCMNYKVELKPVFEG